MKAAFTCTCITCISRIYYCVYMHMHDMYMCIYMRYQFHQLLTSHGHHLSLSSVALPHYSRLDVLRQHFLSIDSDRKLISGHSSTFVRQPKVSKMLSRLTSAVCKWKATCFLLHLPPQYSDVYSQYVSKKIPLLWHSKFFLLL